MAARCCGARPVRAREWSHAAASRRQPRSPGLGRERSGKQREDLAHRFPKLADWEDGRASPTLRQLEEFAKATHTPVGYLLLPEPPEEEIPVPDYRTSGARGVRRPSPDLLDTIFQCQQRQEWYREWALLTREEEVRVVGSLSTTLDTSTAAATLRNVLDVASAQSERTYAETRRAVIERAEHLGVLVMVNGVVGNDTHRRLDPDEFRGFALVDRLAPLVFVNGADSLGAQIFTLAHELAHVWVGASAVSTADEAPPPKGAAAVEAWCNRVAAETLVPLELLADPPVDHATASDTLDALALRFKLSTLVVLRRFHESGRLTRQEFWQAFVVERERIAGIVAERERAGGGSFYRTEVARVGQRFARALIGSALEGQTLRRDALRLLGIRKSSTFEQLAEHLGVR